jgi:hypothetical protein
MRLNSIERARMNNRSGLRTNTTGKPPGSAGWQVVHCLASTCWKSAAAAGSAQR